MRAITGAIVSSQPCSLEKVPRLLSDFFERAASHLPSSDCATYLLATAEAIHEHHQFRLGLRNNHQQGANDLEARGYEGLVEGERNQQDYERNGDMEVSAGGSRGSVEEAGLAAAAGEKKSKKKKKEKEDPREDITVPGVSSQSPASPEIEKRKKEKNSNKDIARAVKQEAGLVAMEELGSEKKKGKKKKEKDRVKLEDDLGEVKEQLVNNGVAEQAIANGEKKRKKKKHAKEEPQANDVNEEKMEIDGDLGSEKKTKKKRGRGGDDDNDQEQEEHTKKKQKKQS